MKTTDIIRKIAYLAIVLSSFFSATASPLSNYEEQEARKEIRKTFDCTVNQLFEADNRYGNITIQYWDKSQVEIVVVVESAARTAEKARELINNIDVVFNQNPQVIGARTTLKSTNRESSSGPRNNSRFSIYYTVTLPREMRARLTQRYGDILMPEMNEGRYELISKYGKIETGSFAQPVKVECAYGKIRMGSLEEIDLEGSYCDNVEIRYCAKGNFDCKYSKINIDRAEQVVFDDSYGTIRIENLMQGTFDMKYGNLKIGNLASSLVLNSFDYCKLNISKVAIDFRNVDITGKYSTAVLAVPHNASFKVSAQNMKYGKSRISGDFKLSDTVIEDNNYLRAVVNGGNKGMIRFDGGNYSNLTVNAL